MNLFEMLVLVHFIADWIFQSQRQASKKHSDIVALLEHSFYYSLFFTPLILWKFGGLWGSLVFVILFLSHALFDNRKFELWLLKKKGILIWKDAQSKFYPYYLDEDKQQKDIDMGLFWIILITIDQMLHIAVLAFIALIIPT
jgi:hypothetical protein